MKCKRMMATACVLAVMVVMAGGASGATFASEKKPGEHDLTGTWRMASTESDALEPAADGSPASYPEGVGGLWFLPRVFRIGTSDNGMALSDSSGTILQVIMYGNVASGDGERMPPRFAGIWKKDRLTVVRQGKPGTKLYQTFTLDENGRKLVVRTKMKRNDAGDLEIKRTYLRVAS